MQCPREEMKDMINAANGAMKADSADAIKARAQQYLDKEAITAALLEAGQMNLQDR